MIYLDFAATTPIHPQVLDVFTQVATRYFGNASSLHDEGSSAKQIIEASSNVIANAFNGSAKGLSFTSGATESNYLAIQALLDGRSDNRKEIISSRMEHSSVINVLERLAIQGYHIHWVDVHEDGRINLDHFSELLNDQTALVTIQYINSELGVIQPIKEIGERLKNTGVLFHSDCVQSFGKIPVDVAACHLDAISISAHKIYGPKGIGAVWVNPDTEWKPLFDDPDQRKSLRFGTSNTSGIAAFAAAVKVMLSDQTTELDRLLNFRSSLIEGLKKTGYELIVEGSQEYQSPYILGIRFPDMEGQFLMLECSQAGLAISTGSACQVGSEKPNRSMKAIGRTDEEARQFVRLSFGFDVKEDHIPEIIEKIDIILARHFSKVHRPVESKT
jgi:cysteine desulfurase